MRLGEHCDEIVRLIDETLGTLGIISTPLPDGALSTDSSPAITGTAWATTDSSRARTDTARATTGASSDPPSEVLSTGTTSSPARTRAPRGATFCAVPAAEPLSR